MIWLLLALLGQVAFACLPLLLIVTASRVPRRKDPTIDQKLLHQYVVEDSISTAKFIERVDKRWAEIDHAPLT